MVSEGRNAICNSEVKRSIPWMRMIFSDALFDRESVLLLSAAKVVRLTEYSRQPRRQRMVRQTAQQAAEGRRLRGESRRSLEHPVTSSKANGPMRLPSSCFLPPDPSSTCTQGGRSSSCSNFRSRLFMNLVNIPEPVSESLEAFRPPFVGL